MAAVQSLLRCPGVDVNVQDAANYGYTPLINAARNGDRQMVQVRKFILQTYKLIYKVTILLSKNLPLTDILDVPPFSMGSRPTNCRKCQNKISRKFLLYRIVTL